MAGVTFLALGNGSPDVFSTFAAMNTHSGSLAVGELIGAAGFITAVVAGSMALVRPFGVSRKSFVRDVGFFIVAASFSMVFLADGHLYLWECATMVAFYLFYVVTVVIWHWYLGQRSRQRLRESLARGHFDVSAQTEPGAREEAEEVMSNDRRMKGASWFNSSEDFAALENGEDPIPANMDEDVDDETRDRWMAEISSNMRLSQIPVRERHHPATPIRPSLVGVLEFRAVLSSLHKSRNMQAKPINLRRYSDDPNLALSRQQQDLDAISEPLLDRHPVDAHEYLNTLSRVSRVERDQATTSTRVRAVSANDVSGLLLDTNEPQKYSVPQFDLLGPTPPGTSVLQDPLLPSGEHLPSASQRRSSSLLLSTHSNDVSAQNSSTSACNLTLNSVPSTYLAPPQDRFLGFTDYSQRRQQNSDLIKGYEKKRSLARVPSMVSHGTAESSPTMPFPLYHDELDYVLAASPPPSLRLSSSSPGSESLHHQSSYQLLSHKPLPWWPYKLLPPPGVLISTLFPTLYSWHNKNTLEKLIGILTAPSVFLLAITLPVVEAGKANDGSGSRSILPISDTVAAPSPNNVLVSPPGTPPLGAPSSDPCNTAAQNRDTYSQSLERTAALVTNDNQRRQRVERNLSSESEPAAELSRDHNVIKSQPRSPPKEWNRWLVSTQIFTAPTFVILIIWANTDTTLSFRNLLFPVLYTLIGSLVVFAVVVFTTSDIKPPRYHVLLCFLGFIVSIAWISTIANEVVGVLKAFGVILGISDAILGLTIFAVGNSLGDLVADITVAKIGYPVMALSACFGGPMLNILLGIGLSGLYMTIRDSNGRHDRHPDRPIKYKPYQIEVGRTLIISGITLLVTLVGLLIVVPLNKWQMDRKIGLGLITLWCLSTVGNLTVEMSPWVSAPAYSG